MSETKSHRQAKRKAAGTSGATEVPLRDGRRIDALSPRRATEVERSGAPRKLKQAAERLRESGKSQKVLQVPNSHMDKAAAAMRDAGVGGTVKNMGSTRRRSVKKRA